MSAHKKSKKVNRAWLNDHLTDPYVKQAQREGYRSRAAYKLKEMDESLHLFKPGQLVVDLGATPGAWSQYVRRKFVPAPAAIGGQSTAESVSRVIALDMLPMEPIDGVEFLLGDFREPIVLAELEGILRGRKVDVVVSDMAPNLSGVADADAARMADLVELAIEFAVQHLTKQGALVCKTFHGSGYSQLALQFKWNFRVAKVIKPKASRDKSAETYLLGIGPKRGPGALKLRP